ncbi:TldD/PmbA family protein [Candidatus Izemoplasma sp. B36]|uniref:TldD/PmbA family protein n=1 Tax=Candidatus Izemoplasma sp. B36 TaxID=3242468 RepID=UPI0035588615
MKTKLSSFLSKQKATIKSMVLDLSKEFKYISVLGEETIGTAYNVNRSSSSVTDSRWSQRGFVARVYNGVNYSEYSFNKIEDIDLIKNEIRKVAKNDLEKYLEKGSKLMTFPLIDEEEISKEFYSEYQINPFEISAEEKLAKLTDIVNTGLKKHENFIDFRASFEEVKVSKIFISNKKDLAQSILYTVMYLVPIGKCESGIKYDFKGFSGLKGFEIFDEAYNKIDEASQSVIDLFKSTTVDPGEYEIICDAAVSGLIAHEAFGHGVEMDMFVKNRAKGEEYMNKYVASKLVNMRDGALSGVEVGTYLFDDEGTLGTDTLVIDNGVLASGISDLLSAMKLGTTPTGNGRRESYERKAYARMTNTFFEAGNETLEDMIKNVKKGYLLEGYFSGMEDPKNWGIQCVIAKGKEIIDGEFTGNVISPVTLTGYVPDLLKSIKMVSSKPVELSGTGYCGKGHKELVKTSTGGTYILAKGRLS